MKTVYAGAVIAAGGLSQRMEGMLLSIGEDTKEKSNVLEHC